MQTKLSQIESEIKENELELNTPRTVKPEIIPPENTAICTTYDELLHKQKEFQNEIFELEQSIAVLQKESKQAIKEAEVERDDIFDKAEKQMDAVRESDLLIDHLKNAAEMDVLPKLQALQSEIEAIDKQTHEKRVGMQQESVSAMLQYVLCIISTV
jgi:hypothetical protein